MNYQELFADDLNFPLLRTRTKPLSDCTRRAGKLRTYAEYRNLVAECALGTEVVTRLNVLGAALRSLGRFGRVDAPESLLALAYIALKSLTKRWNPKTIIAVITYINLKEALAENKISCRLTTSELVRIAQIVNGVFRIDDCLDDEHFVEQVRHQSNPREYVSRYMESLSEYKLIHQSLEQFEYIDSSHKAVTFALTDKLERNSAEVVAASSQATSYDSNFACKAIFAMSGIFTQLALSLYLIGIDRRPSHWAALKIAFKRLVVLGIQLQCIDDFVDCVRDGEIYGNDTGVNVFRSVLFESQSLTRLAQFSKLDYVRLANEFPDEIVTFFYGIGDVPEDTPILSAFRDTVLLHHFKTYL